MRETTPQGTEGLARLPVTAAVLAGGRSVRMGADKTLLPVDGASLLRRVVEVTTSTCERTIVVTNAPDSLADADVPIDLEVYADEIPHQGPLGGLITALAHSSHEWVLAVAADLPWLRAPVVRALWDHRDGAQIVVPVTEKGPEPLLALYRTDCLEIARTVMASGRRRLVALFPRADVVEVSTESLRAVDPELSSLINVNTPEDLLRARDSAPADEGLVTPAVIEAGSKGRSLPSERPVTVHMNDVEIATVQSSPSHLDELAVGFLVAEGLLTDRDAFEKAVVDEATGLVYVTSHEEVPDDMVYRRRFITSGCGKGVTFSSVGHAENLEAVESSLTVDSAALYAMMRELAQGAVAYRDTGGMHACGLGMDGALVVLREDVGRHNALDKVLGRAWLDRLRMDDAVLVTTGRVSYEMAVKAAKMRVPVVASRTAVTDLAVEVAESVGVTLAGYVRGGRLVVYSGAGRITEEGDA